MPDQIPPDAVRETLLDAALAHVPFDGWTQASFDAAITDTGLGRDVAVAACPRGALDLAAAYHRRGDAAMVARLASEDLSALRYRDRIAAAVRFRLEAVEDKELVRRAATLFALPQHGPEGARLIWGTADAIWNALGDSSRDVNWYTKRATLSAVYSATLLFWLGDDSPGNVATWAFLDRRIDNVMQFEKVKASLRENPVLSRIFAVPARIIGGVRAPDQQPMQDVPGRWEEPQEKPQ